MRKIIYLLLLVVNLLYATENRSEEYPYWHLVSLPNDINISEYFGDNVFVTFTYNDANSTWTFESSNSSLKKIDGFSSIEKSDNSRGYWIKAKVSDPSTLIVYSTTDNQNDINITALSDGWHLVSSKNYTNISDKFNTKHIKSVWDYSALSGWSLYLPDYSGKNVSDTTLRELTSIDSKKGYWINKQNIINNPPSSVISVDNSNPLKLETISFISNSSDADNDTLTYFWDFGDGVTSTDKDILYSYSNQGTYNVTFRVTDSECGSSVETLTVVVQDKYPNPNIFSSNLFPCSLKSADSDITMEIIINYVDRSTLSVDSTLIYNLQELRDAGLSIEDQKLNLSPVSISWSGNFYKFEYYEQNLNVFNYSDSYGNIAMYIDKVKSYAEYHPYSNSSFGKSIMIGYLSVAYNGMYETSYFTDINDVAYEDLGSYSEYKNDFDNKFDNLNLKNDSNESVTAVWSSECQDELKLLFDF